MRSASVTKGEPVASGRFSSCLTLSSPSWSSKNWSSKTVFSRRCSISSRCSCSRLADFFTAFWTWKHKVRHVLVHLVSQGFPNKCPPHHHWYCKLYWGSLNSVNSCHVGLLWYAASSLTLGVWHQLQQIVVTMTFSCVQPGSSHIRTLSFEFLLATVIDGATEPFHSGLFFINPLLKF